MHAVKKMHVDIVSLEYAIFSGEIEQLITMGTLGELGIMPGHAPLLTFLKPGEVRLVNQGREDVFYVSGGILEVQPNLTTILADTVIRAKDLDELAALAVQQRTERTLQSSDMNDDYYTAALELARALAQLRTISRFKKQS